MKKIHFLLAAGLFLIGTATASAQFMGSSSRVASTSEGYNSVWVGYAPTKAKFAYSGFSSTLDKINTFSVGALHAAPLQNFPLLYEFGGMLEWSRYSDSSSNDGFKETMTGNLIGLRIPLNLLYAYDLGNGLTVYPYLGLNVKGYIVGKVTEKYSYEGESYTETYNLFSKKDMEKMAGGGIYDDDYDYYYDDDMDDFGVAAKPLNRFTLGYQLGLRVGYSNFFGSVGYMADLTKITDHTTVNMITLGVGMSF